LVNVNIKIAKLEFIEKAKILLEINPYISISDLLVEYKVIPPIRKLRPTPDIIEAAGYKHDGMGNILGRRGQIMKAGTNGKYKNIKGSLQNQKYKIVTLSIPNFGLWCIQLHTLVFALHHRRYPRDGYVLDHIDDDRFNNHPDNLRECTPYENNFAIKDATNNIATITNFFN